MPSTIGLGAIPGFAVAALTAALFVSAAPMHAQSQEAASPYGQRALVLQGGQWHADLQGTVAAVRVELPASRDSRWLLVPGLSYAHYSYVTATRIDVLVPEAVIHLQLAQGPIRPYVGGGAGLALINVIHTVDPELLLEAGVRADLRGGWGMRVGLDARSFGRFEAGTVGWTFGMARQF